MIVQIGRKDCLGSWGYELTKKIVTNVKPKLSGQTERFEINSFVMTMKTSLEVACFEVGAKKARTVSD